MTSFPCVQANAAAAQSFVTFGSPVQAGSIIIAVFCGDKIPATGCTDSIGNYYQLYAASNHQWHGVYGYQPVVQIWVAQGTSEISPYGGVAAGTCTVTFSGFSVGNVAGPSLLICEYRTPSLYQIFTMGTGVDTLTPCVGGPDGNTISCRATANNGYLGGGHCADTGDGAADNTGILGLSINAVASIPEFVNNNSVGVLLMNFPSDVLIVGVNYNTAGYPISPYFTSNGTIRAMILQPDDTEAAAVADLYLPYLLVPLTASCGDLPTGCVGTAFGPGGAGQAPVVTGGTPPYSYKLTGGFLPLGLSVDEDTGVISGTPSVPGIFQFDITVTDAVFASIVLTCTIIICVCGSTPSPGGVYISSR
jgi:hypothetical protein